MTNYFWVNTYIIALKDVVQGLRSLQNRSLLSVNEDFEGKRNAEKLFLEI